MIYPIFCLQIASPACTELEMVTMDWLGKMLQLPEHFLFSSQYRKEIGIGNKLN